MQLQGFHEKNGHITEFAGFSLPLWFKGIIPEALAVRNAAGVFDVSHMGRARVQGKDARTLLDNITTNDVGSLRDLQGQYSLICNSDGGIKDDVVVFRLKDREFLIVYNAGNRVNDYNWILTNSRGLSVIVEDVSDEVAMFAVQGPKAREIVQQLSSAQLAAVSRFGCSWTELAGVKVLISRTGYTGEDGFEVFVSDSPIGDPENARRVWDELLQTGKPYGLEPCGLGARDLLRLETGLCLYGTDIDEKTNPYEARLNFVVKLHKDFIGREKLKEIKEIGPSRIRVGLITTRRVIPRQGVKITNHGNVVGTVTSGTFSPLVNSGIAMGYVEREVAQEGTELDIQIRDRPERATVVKPPFYDTSKYGFSRKN